MTECKDDEQKDISPSKVISSPRIKNELHQFQKARDAWRTYKSTPRKSLVSLSPPLKPFGQDFESKSDNLKDSITPSMQVLTVETNKTNTPCGIKEKSSNQSTASTSKSTGNHGSLFSFSQDNKNTPFAIPKMTAGAFAFTTTPTANNTPAVTTTPSTKSAFSFNQHSQNTPFGSASGGAFTFSATPTTESNGDTTATINSTTSTSKSSTAASETQTASAFSFNTDNNSTPFTFPKPTTSAFDFSTSLASSTSKVGNTTSVSKSSSTAAPSTDVSKPKEITKSAFSFNTENKSTPFAFGNSTTSTFAFNSTPSTNTTASSTASNTMESTKSAFSFNTDSKSTPFSFGNTSGGAFAFTTTPAINTAAGTTTTSTSSAKSETTTSNTNTSSINKDKEENKFREWLIAFYEKHNPSKLSSVDSTLKSYEGKEEVLFQKLNKKYCNSTLTSSQYPVPSGSGPICFLDISIGNRLIGKIEIKLFMDKVPLAAENFRALCTGELGSSRRTGNKLHYKKCSFHRIVPGFVLQAGDYTKHNGTGGESIYSGTPEGDLWGNFKDEKPFMQHSKRGVLSMANNGPNRNGSQFFITLKRIPHLDGKHVVFGEVISGMEVVDEIEKVVETDKGSKPLPHCSVIIEDCGECK